MTGTIHIDALRPADVARCAELERVLFPGDDPWSERAFRDELRAGHHYLAARTPGPPTGAAPARSWSATPGWPSWPARRAPEAEIHTIGVDPAYRRLGIGRALLRGLLEVADAARATVFLEVRTDNDAARALYEAAGFSVAGVRKRYYRPSGADAFTMRREPR